MPTARPMSIRAPLGGKFTRLDYQTQPPYTLLDCRDMWPVEASTGRARLATRPGFAAVDSQASVNMIATLAVAADSGSQTTYKRQLIIATGGTAYKNTTGTSFTSCGTGIDTGRTVYASSYYSTLYICNTASYKKLAYGGTVAAWADVTGTKPLRCQLITTWGARIVLAGDPQNPHVVNFSRVDDPDDWDFTAEDTGAPVTVPDIMEPVTSLIPHDHECLICGTFNSMWVFRGNPTNGGSLVKFAHMVGPVSPNAWCKDSHGNTYMLTRDGLYRMPPGCGDNPQSISREKVPLSLIGLEGVNDTVFMEYDTRFRMIHIYVVGTNAQYFHFFPETESFWPVTTPGSGIAAIGRYDPFETSTLSGVIVGTTANLVRLDSAATIGGSSHAYAKIGPVKISDSPYNKSKITDAVFSLGANTNDSTGTFDFYTAEDAEAVANLPAGRTWQITVAKALSNRRCWPHLSGHALLVHYTQGSTSAKLTFDQLDLALSARGKERAS